MTIDLPTGWERYIRDQVQSGRFPNPAAVVLDALERQSQVRPSPPVESSPADPVLGSMREDADLLDAIVEQAMKNRSDQPWRSPAGG